MLNFIKKRKKIIIVIVLLLLICFSFSFLVKTAVMYGFAFFTNGRINIGGMAVKINRLVADDIKVRDGNNNSVISVKEIDIRYGIFNVFMGRAFVDKVKVVEPSVYLKKLDHGTWNVSTIFKQGKKKKKKDEEVKIKGIYKGEIIVEGGKVKIEDIFVAKRSTKLDKINFRYNYFDRNNTVSGSISQGGKKMTVEGSMRKGNLYTLLSASDILLVDYINYLFVNRDFFFRDGVADLDIWFITGLKSGITDYQGSLYVDDGAFYCKGFPYEFHDMTGKIDISDNCLFSKGIDALFGTVPVSAKGVITDFAWPFLIVDIEAVDFDLKQIGKFWTSDFEIDITGNASAFISIKGKGDLPVIKADIEAENVAYLLKDSSAPGRLKDILFGLEFYDDILFVNDITAKAGDGKLSASGMYMVKEPQEVILSVKGSGLELGRIIPGFKNDTVDFKSDFYFCVAGPVKDPVMFGSADLSEMLFITRVPGKASASFVFGADLFYLKKAGIFQGSKKVAEAGGEVDFKSSVMDFNIWAKNLNFSGRGFKTLGPFTGRLSLGGGLRGTFKDPRFFAFLKNASFAAEGLSAGRLGFDAYFEPDKLLLDKGAGIVLGAPVNFGYYQNNKAEELQGYLLCMGADLSSLNRTFARDNFKLFGKSSDINLYFDGNKHKGYFYSFGLDEKIKNINMTGFNNFYKNGGTALSVLSANNIDVASIIARPDLIKGVIYLDSILRIRNGTYFASGNFDLKEGMLATLPMESGYYDLEFSADRLIFDTLSLFGKTMFLGLTGEISLNDADVKYHLINRKLSNVDEVLNLFGISSPDMVKTKDIKFEVSTAGSLKYKNNNLNMLGFLNIPGGLINDDFFTLKTDFEYADNRLNFKPVEFYQGDGKLCICGSIDVSGKKSMDLNIITNKLNIKKIMQATAFSSQDIEGKLSSNFSVKGEMSKPAISGSIDIFNLKLMGKVFKELKLDLTSSNRSYVLSDLKLTVNKGEILGFGSINDRGILEFTFYADDFPLAEMPFMSDYLGEVEGAGKFNIKVLGSVSSPHVIAKLEYENVVINDKKFSKALCNADFENSVLNLNPLYIEEEKDSPGGIKQKAGRGKVPSYNLSGSIDFSASGGKNLFAAFGAPEDKQPVFDLELTSVSGSLSTILALMKSGLKDRLNGTIDSYMMLGGVLANPKLVLRGSLKDGLFDKTKIDSLKVDLGLEDKNWTINDVVLTQSAGWAKASGTINTAGNIEIKLNTNNLDVGFLNPFLPGGHRISGMLNSVFAASNSCLSPDIEGGFRLYKGSFDGFGFDEFSGIITGADGMLQFKDWKVLKGKHQIKAYGNMPIVIQRGEFYTSAPLEFNVKFSEKDLSILNLLGDIVETSTGPINGEIKFSGPIYDIEMHGNVTVKNGYIKFNQVDTPMEDIDIKITFVDDRLRFDEFGAKMGGGSFNLSGDISFEGFLPEEYDLNLKLSSLKIYSAKYYSGELDGDISLKGPSHDKKLAGMLKAIGGNLNLLELANVAKKMGEKPGKKAPAELDSTAYNLDLILDNVWLNSQSNVLSTHFKSTGLLEIRGRDAKPTLKGQINFSQGSINFYNTSFKIIDGMAFFDGREDMMPKIDLEARTTVSDVDIFVELSGSIDRPVSAFTSDPPLSEDQIVALLASKILPSVPLAGNQGLFSKYMYSALQMSVLQPLIQSISQNILSGDVGFDYGGPGIWSVKIAKAIGSDDKFFMTYTRVYGMQGIMNEIWGMEYKLQRRTMLMVENDQFGNYFYGIKATYQY
ncbi:MAG: translocation/assembly module TamB domain-containing protein [Armatimonadota bacterium]